MTDTSLIPRIMIVDDETEFSTLFKLRLEAEGYHVTYCPNGATALAQAPEIKPDLVMLDIMMPDISGLEVIQKLRAAPETKDAYVIMYSALTKQGDSEKALELGADEFIVKSNMPFAQVIERVNTALSERSTKG